MGAGVSRRESGQIWLDGGTWVAKIIYDGARESIFGPITGMQFGVLPS